MLRFFFRPFSDQRIIAFTYVRWPEDGLRKTETCCHSKIPISYTTVVLLTDYTSCLIVRIETQQDVFN